MNQLLSLRGLTQMYITTTMVEFSDGSDRGAQVLSRKDSESLFAELEKADGVEQMTALSIVTRSSQRASIQVIKELIREVDADTYDLDWSGIKLDLLPRAMGNSIRLDGRVEIREEISSGLHGNIDAVLSTFSGSLETGQSLVVPMMTPGTSSISTAAVIHIEVVDAKGNRIFENEWDTPVFSRVVSSLAYRPHEPHLGNHLHRTFRPLPCRVPLRQHGLHHLL